MRERHDRTGQAAGCWGAVCGGSSAPLADGGAELEAAHPARHGEVREDCVEARAGGAHGAHALEGLLAAGGDLDLHALAAEADGGEGAAHLRGAPEEAGNEVRAATQGAESEFSPCGPGRRPGEAGSGFCCTVTRALSSSTTRHRIGGTPRLSPPSASEANAASAPFAAHFGVPCAPHTASIGSSGRLLASPLHSVSRRSSMDPRRSPTERRPVELMEMEPRRSAGSPAPCVASMEGRLGPSMEPLRRRLVSSVGGSGVFGAYGWLGGPSCCAGEPGALCCEVLAEAALGDSCTGMVTKKQLPLPGPSERQPTDPPIPCAVAAAIASPRPLPPPCSSAHRW